MAWMERLPEELLRRASLRRSEHAWRMADIPAVIEASRAAGLLNIGGNLQIRLPTGKVWESWNFQVDTGKSVPAALPWDERVGQAAEVAQRDFALERDDDYLSEARAGGGALLDEAVAAGLSVSDVIWFTWCAAEEGVSTEGAPSPLAGEGVGGADG